MNAWRIRVSSRRTGSVVVEAEEEGSIEVAAERECGAIQGRKLAPGSVHLLLIMAFEQGTDIGPTGRLLQRVQDCGVARRRRAHTLRRA